MDKSFFVKKSFNFLLNILFVIKKVNSFLIKNNSQGRMSLKDYNIYTEKREYL